MNKLAVAIAIAESPPRMSKASPIVMTDSPS